jgi:hypothetical protein
MTAPVTTYKAITLPEQSVTATWGDALNNGVLANLDSIVGGIVTKTVTNANVTLSAAEAKNAIVRITGTLTGSLIVSIPSNGLYAVQNATTGSFQVFVAGSAGAAQEVPQGISTIVHIDATNGAFIAGARASTVGMIAPFVGTTIPKGWLKCNGALVSRTAYAALWTYAQASGTITTDSDWQTGWWGRFSTGDASTTFRVPDLRAAFIRSWADDKATGYDVGRACGDGQQPDNIAHTHSGTTGDQSATHYHGTTGAAGSNGSYGDGAPVRLPSGTGSSTGDASNGHVHTFTTGSSGGAETRPFNVSMMYCVSYL